LPHSWFHEMGKALILVEGDDPCAGLLASAFRRHRWSVRVVDLRFGWPTLDASADPVVVRVDGCPVDADIVINRTGISGLGLSSAAALDRQLPTSWSGRHLAAREEQGLMLACLDVWDRASRLYNPVRTTDRRLLRPAVEAELAANGVPVGRVDGAPGEVTACWVVDGEVAASATRPLDGPWRETAPSTAVTDLVVRTAALTGLRLGEVDLWQPVEGSAVVTNWRPAPPFRTTFEQSGIDAAALVVAALLGETPATANAFLADDLEPNLLGAPNQAPNQRV
jgi:hypothetical protein